MTTVTREQVQEALRPLVGLKLSIARRAADMRVTAVLAMPCGGAEIHFSDGSRLTIFPDGSDGEQWRLLPSDEDAPHFVVGDDEI